MPDSGSRIGNLVTHEPDAVVWRIGLNLVHCGARPCQNGSLHAHGGAGRRKCVVVPAAADVKPTVGGIIVHVALPGMRLAPGVLVWSDVLSFAKIGRARVLRRI